MENEPIENTPEKQPPRRSFCFGRFVRRLLISILAVCGAIWIIQQTVLPWIVRREVRKTLTALGFANPSFVMRNVSFGRAVVTQIAGAGPREPSIDAAVIVYSFPALFSGHLDEIDLTGARVIFDAGHGTMGLNFSDASSLNGPIGSLPVGKIVLKSSNLIMHWGSGEYWLSTSGTMENLGGKLNVHLDGVAASTAMVLDGTIDPSANMADLDLNISNIPLVSLPMTKSVTGTVDVLSHFHQSDGKSLFDATISSKQILLQPMRIVMHDVKLSLNGSIAKDANGLVTNISPNSSATIGQVDFPGWILNSGNPNQPVARVNFSSCQISAAGAQAAATLAMSDFAMGGATMHIPMIGISGSVNLDDSAVPRVDAALQFKKASIKFRNAWARDVSGTLPVRWNTSGKSGTLRFQNVGIGKTSLPGPTATMALEDGHLQIDANWNPLQESNFAAGGTFDLTKLPVRGELNVKLPQFKLSNPGEAASLFPNLHGATVLGTFSGEGDIKLDAGHLRPHLTLHADDVQIAGRDYDLQIDGAGGAFTVDSFSPLTTPGHQAVFVASAQIGKLALTHGNVFFRIESAKSVLVEQSDWQWEDGKLYSSAFRIDPSPTSSQFTVEGDNLSMKSILSTFFPEQAGGEGRLYARMPLQIRWPQIVFGSGFLYSAPGGGAFQLGSSLLSSLGDMLDNNDPRFKTDDTFKQVKARALEAMTNFQYDILTIDWKPGPEGLFASLHFHGKGQSDTGQPMNMTINFNNVDKVLTRSIIMRKEASQP